MDKFKYLIPEESNDAASLDASALRHIESDLRKVFENHGYEELLLPTFEYVNLYDGLEANEESMFQFLNHEGKRIALRTDFTVPIARLYNNANTSSVRRYSYFGKVYRMQERHKGRSSELFQGGVELIGQPGEKGDQECLSLIQESMKVLALDDLKLELGSARFFKRLVALTHDQSIVEILDKKEISEMAHFVERNHIDGSLKELLLKLPQSFGGIEEIQSVKALIDDEELKQAIEELEKLYENALSKEDIVFDLCMVPSQSYYTGVMMKGYSYHSAEPILQGGRYDHLFDHFGSDIPAIGFSYHLNHVLNAYGKENEDND